MTSFGWKRKIGSTVLKEAAKTFEANSKDFEDEVLDGDDVDWISLAAKKKCLQLEDARTKSERLRLDGVTLAEAERHWEALHKWDEALQLTPNDEKLHEMKAQVLMSLGEVYPAVCAAEKAVSLNANWWIGHQTLGRAQLGLGEVTLALKSFCRALHINPANTELREDDVMWAAELVRRKAAFDDEKLAASVELTNSLIITDSDAEQSDIEDDIQNTNSCSLFDELKTLPPNYAVIRD